MSDNLKGINWILASLALFVISGVLTLVLATTSSVRIFVSVYTVISIVLCMFCYIGYRRKDRRWAIGAMAIGLFIVGFGIFGTALDVLNEFSLAGGLVLVIGGIIGANN